MRRSNVQPVEVKNPSQGLLTSVPPDLGKNQQRYIVDGENIRAEFGQLKSAPGYERVHTETSNIDAPANLVFQASIVGTDPDSATSPLIGTEQSLYVMRRRARILDCDAAPCSVTFAVIGNTGDNDVHDGSTIPVQDVVTMIRGWDPKFILHTGDLISGDGTWIDGENPFEEMCGRFFASFIGSYTGAYAPGSTTNKFFPAVGEEDHDSPQADRYFDFFGLPPPEKYYSVRLGPVEVFVLDSVSPSTGSPSGTGEADVSWATSVQKTWLTAAVAASTATWRIVMIHHPAVSSGTEVTVPPGFSAVDWPFETLGIDLVLSGHCHNYERLTKNGVVRVVCGLGGRKKVGFGSPVSGSVVRYSGDYGALKITANFASLTGVFYSRDGVEQDSFTLDAQRSPGVCVLSDAAKEIASLSVFPDAATIEVGQTMQYTATVWYVDGTSEDVTGVAGWSSSDIVKASVSVGKATGNQVGTAVITATHGGFSDTATIEVVAKCIDTPVDVMLVTDVSGSMGAKSGPTTRMERAKQATKLFVDAIEGLDRLGLIKFSGDYINQIPNASIVAPLGSTKSSMYAEIDKLTPFGGTGIAAAIDAARVELSSSRHTAGNRQMIVLFTDGFANVSVEGQTYISPPANPSSGAETAGMAAAAASASAARAAQMYVVVIALDLSYDPVKEATVQSWATPGYYFSAASAEELPQLFAKVLSELCRSGGSEPPPVVCVEIEQGPAITLPYGTHALCITGEPVVSMWVSREFSVAESPNPSYPNDIVYSLWCALSGHLGEGTPPTFSVVSGSIPPGILLNTESGQLTGIPTVAGMYTFDVEVQSCTTSFTVSVPLMVADCEAVFFNQTSVDLGTLTSPLPGTVGVPLTNTFAAVERKIGSAHAITENVTLTWIGQSDIEGMGIPVTFTVVSGTMPPGLSLDSATAEFTGTPTTAGTYTVMVQISNACTTELAPDTVTESDTQKLVTLEIV